MACLRVLGGALLGTIVALVSWLALFMLWPELFFGPGARTYTDGQRPFWDRDSPHGWIAMTAGCLLGGGIALWRCIRSHLSVRQDVAGLPDDQR